MGESKNKDNYLASKIKWLALFGLSIIPSALDNYKMDSISSLDVMDNSGLVDPAIQAFESERMDIIHLNEVEVKKLQEMIAEMEPGQEVVFDNKYQDILNQPNKEFRMVLGPDGEQLAIICNTYGSTSGDSYMIQVENHYEIVVYSDGVLVAFVANKDEYTAAVGDGIYRGSNAGRSVYNTYSYSRGSHTGNLSSAGLPDFLPPTFIDSRGNSEEISLGNAQKMMQVAGDIVTSAYDTQKGASKE